MTPHTLNGKTLLAIPKIPDDARGFAKAENGQIVYLHGQGMWNFLSFIDLNLDEYTILGRCNEISEAVAETLVDEKTISQLVDAGAGGGGYLDYTKYLNYENEQYEFDTALESLHSYFRKEGIENNRLIILKNS